MNTRQEIVAALETRRAEIDGEVSELAEPVRAPGVQVQFGKRAGDHTSDAVMQMQRSISASQLHQLSLEIERALEKLDEDSYGVCDVCGDPIAEERLEALPWATLCVNCRAKAPPEDKHERQDRQEREAAELKKKGLKKAGLKKTTAKKTTRR